MYFPKSVNHDESQLYVFSSGLHFSVFITMEFGRQQICMTDFLAWYNGNFPEEETQAAEHLSAQIQMKSGIYTYVPGIINYNSIPSFLKGTLDGIDGPQLSG